MYCYFWRFINNIPRGIGANPSLTPSSYDPMPFFTLKRRLHFLVDQGVVQKETPPFGIAWAIFWFTPFHSLEIFSLSPGILNVLDVTVCGNDLERQSEGMLPRKQPDKRENSPQPIEDRAKGSEGTLPKFSGCNGDGRGIVLSNLQDCINVALQ